MKESSDKLQKRTVLITGITSGIGEAIAYEFAKNGWNIVGHISSNVEKTHVIAENIKKVSVSVSFIRADFSDEKEIGNFISKLTRVKIDSIVNNAGSYVAQKHFSELTMRDLEKAFRINLFAPILISVKIFNSMKERRFGRIVNISSIAAKYGGSSYSMHYGCSKLALEGLTKTLSKEGAEYNVFVNTIRPGVIDTEFHKKFPKDMSKRIELIPMKRMGAAEDIADIAYYLGSEKNRFITNEIINIAGGE